MKIELQVKDQMVKRFQLLPLALKLSTAAERLSRDRLGVVVNRSRNPITVVTSEDIARAQEYGYKSVERLASDIPRVMVTGARTPMELVVRGIAPSLQEAVRDIVVVGRRGIVGVVPVEGAVFFMKQRKAFKPLLTSLSFRGARVGRWYPETHLAGGLDRPKCSDFLCECGFVNCLFFYPISGREPTCLNPKVVPHRLKIAR